MELNRDQKTRDKILFEKEFSDRLSKYVGGAKYFESLDLDTLLLLVNKNFISIKDRQEDYPYVIKFAQLLKFCEKNIPHCTARLTGYAVYKRRDDYRISIDGCRIRSAESLPKELIIKFFNLAINASSINIQNCYLYCWFD